MGTYIKNLNSLSTPPVYYKENVYMLSCEGYYFVFLGAESLPDLGLNDTLDLEHYYPRSGFGSGFVSPHTSPSIGTPLKRLVYKHNFIGNLW